MTDDPFVTDFDPEIGVAETIAPGLRRLVAPNASPMTFRGTNTYLLGSANVAVIDPGPLDDNHLAAILKATAGQVVSHIFVTHSHVDHSPLAGKLGKTTGAKIYALGDSSAGRTERMKMLGEVGELGGGEGVDQSFLPDVCLSHGEVIKAGEWTLKALATPGHFSNHMCFSWEETGCLFTGDHVMSWASTMVSPPDGDIRDFMNSLSLLEERTGDQRYFPGHGVPVEEPLKMVRYLRSHRQSREAQIIAALKSGPNTPAGLASLIYTDTPNALLPAAARNVFAHLIDLVDRNRIRCNGNPTPDCSYHHL